jgi:hypothetical protein
VVRWTNWFLLSCWVSARGALDEAPVIRLDSDWISLGWGVCGGTTCSYGKGEEDGNAKWKVRSNLS